MKNRTMLLVANYPSDVGYAWWLMEEFWVSIATAAQTRGRKCILAFPKLGKVSPRLREAPIELLELDVQAALRGQWRPLRQLIHERAVELVYLTDWPYRSILYGALRLWGVRRIVMHDHMPGERPPTPFLRRWPKRALHKIPWWTCDLYIGVSEFVYRRFLNHVFLPPDRCTYVRNGITPILDEEWDPGRAQREFGFPDEAIVVISSGRAHRYKRVDLIARAGARVFEALPDVPVRFVHCGDGPDLKSLQLLTQSLAIDNRFVFAGQRDDVRRLLTSAQVAVHASQGEAFSLSILEYMSAGLATVVPDNSGNREAIDHGSTGLVVDDGNEQALADAIIRLLVDSELRIRLGSSARRAVEERFTLDRARRELVEAITSLAWAE